MEKLTDLTSLILLVLHRNRSIYLSLVLMLATALVLLSPVPNLLSVFSIYGSYGMLIYAILEVNFNTHRTFYNMHGIRRISFESLKGALLFGGIILKSFILYVFISTATAN